MKRIIWVNLIIWLFLNLAGDTGVVLRDHATMRKGPGAMFEIIGDLAKGTEFVILQEQMGWYEIEVEETEGFVSVKVTQEPRTQADVFAMMGTQDVNLQVSTHGMSAGVKGFAERFSTSFAGNQDFLDTYSKWQLDTERYERFKKETYLDGKTYTRAIQIPLYEEKDYFTFSEEGIGLGIASRIAALGIYKNDFVTEYVNQVGHLIVEVTDVYDVGFKFFILDTDKANAYACPGGTIFITKGMLEHIWSEAELACILAHEIAHVARQHGMKELEERKHHVKADDAFAELDMEMEEIGMDYDQHTKDVEAEMEKLAFDIFETIFNGRLADYEKEADYLAMIYAARAGYDARQLLDILDRLLVLESETTNEHYTQEQIRIRVDDVRNNLQRLILPDTLFDHRERWQEIAIYLKY